jgi:hypothetical protein
MLNNDCKRIVRHRLLPENMTDKQGNPLSLKTFVTFGEKFGLSPTGS